MKVACIVLAHRGPDQLRLLLTALRSPDVQVYLHLDSKTRLDPFRATLAEASEHGMTMLERRRSRWGGPEVVDASLDGLIRGIQDGCDYFLLISGQDFPMRPLDEIIAFLEANRETSYIEYWDLPTSRWRFGGRDRTDFYSYNLFGRRETCIPVGEDTSNLNWRGRTINQALRLAARFRRPRTFPTYARPVGGVQWWNLSHAAVEHVLGFIAAHPDYRRYHQYTILPDEMFFQSILVGTDFAQTAQIVNDDLRYMEWEPSASHPRTLRSADLPAVLEGKDLFARKFDLAVDREALSELWERTRG